MATADPASGPPPLPDLMNDPAFDLNSKGKQKSLDDVDTCRICRGEGSEEEPLFYPCKCSGSIKFVHQNCLMEWLSHSQKKHCELCKTPFRFTKLYHPQMPSSVPLPVFLRKAALHTWKTFLTWARIHLVLFVWVAWLPWCMRTVWRGLFWIGDGGWINWQKMEEQALVLAKERLDKLAVEGTSPANAQLLASKNAAASVVVSQVANALPQFLFPISQTLNFTGEPILFKLARRLIIGIIGRSSNESASFHAKLTLNNTDIPNAIRRSSWLSDFRFLNSLTRSPMFNKLLIDTLEGQLITLLVVIAFVLIFLIREWVVQQQPGMNIGAAPNANPPVVQQAGEVDAEQDAHQREQIADHPPEQILEGPSQAALNEPTSEQAGEPRLFRRTSSQQQTPPLPDEAQNATSQTQLTNLEESATKADSARPSHVGASTDRDSAILSTGQIEDGKTIASSSMISQRPSMPNRDMTRDAEIRRTLEEQSQILDYEDWPGLKVFTELWKRAEKKPSEVLRIIEEEGRMDELRWIVTAMLKVKSSHPPEVEDEGTDEHERGPLFSNLRERNIIEVVEMERYEANSGGQNKDIDFDVKKSRQAQKRNTPYYSERDQAIDIDDEGQSQLSKSTTDSDNAQTPNSTQVSSSSQKPQDQKNPLNSQINSNASLTVQPIDNPFHADYSEPTENQDHNIPSSSTVADVLEFEIDKKIELEASTGPIIESDDTSQDTVRQEHQNVVVHQGLADNIMNWLWGGIDPLVNIPADNPEPEGGDDEHIVDDLADEAPFVPVEHGRPVIADDDNAEDATNAPNIENLEIAGNVENAAQNPEILEAAPQAGADPNGADAADDGEDLEGIMELIGMQGPLAGLIQNGMICAVLVSMTIFLGVWIPYIAGKLFLVFLANPVSLLFKLPLRWASMSADLIIDLGVFSAGCVFYWVDTVVRLLCAPVGWMFPSIERISRNRILAETAKSYAEGAMERLAKTFIITGGSVSESDIPTFSIIAHESLQLIEYRVGYVTQTIRNTIFALVKISYIHPLEFGNFYQWLYDSITANAKGVSSLTTAKAREISALTRQLVEINPLRVSLNIPQRTTPLDYTLAYWNTKDRVLAVVFGYMFFSVIGMVYLKINASLRGKNKRGRFDGIFADILYQAGGVLKVILIISIEMIVFPLYCGLLLDVALLPLFGNVTIKSRVNFLLASPNTSLFVHWFVGTCYMFHFALFVSMCRKIMRNGVLYFIRDPDDPTFHPVRDVLERSVSTQLRKIAFSALVYGALVVLCLGGVVWGIYFSFDNVFPIHWSSNEPVLEFPVDLLFYNFLMPLAVKFFKPSVGLNKIYGWWFRKCARALRLSHFLFGDRAEDEEGYHVRRSWKDWLLRTQGDFVKPVIGNDRRLLAEDRDMEVFFLRDGRYVRAPASDQVRIPKGVGTFLEVDENGARVDGLPDADKSLHGNNEMFVKVYIPPYFRLRISLFILLIWLFAATTGVSFTLIPLVLGRFVFAHLIPNHLRMNDIYAFSIGLYILGGTGYSIVYFRKIFAIVRASLFPNPQSNSYALLRRATGYSVRLIRLLYTYLSFGLLLPALFSLLIEFYIVIPLHTYFGSPTERHIIHFIQDWTLGVLYIKMLGRLIMWNAPSRPADALRAIVRHGWLNPDIRLATRSFILPASILMAFALTTPLGLGWAINKTVFATADPADQSRVYRYSYPGVLALGMLLAALWGLSVAFRGWRQRIRDEVYLIGERLHNFGEKRGGKVVKGKRVVSRI